MKLQKKCTIPDCMCRSTKKKTNITYINNITDPCKRILYSMI